jgi:peptide/nickel transport system substrate-binding protein
MPRAGCCGRRDSLDATRHADRRRGDAVEFTILTNAGNNERTGMATIIQDDLKQLGISVHVVTLELRALVDRLLKTHEYEACVLGLGNPDANPNAEMNVWLSSGATHLWHPEQSRPATPWEAEIDGLMRRQLTTLDANGKRLTPVQELVAQNLPLIFLASPNVLVGGHKGLGNFRPAVLDHHTLWNVEELFWRQKRPVAPLRRAVPMPDGVTNVSFGVPGRRPGRLGR